MDGGLEDAHVDAQADSDVDASFDARVEQDAHVDAADVDAADATRSDAMSLLDGSDDASTGDAAYDGTVMTDATVDANVSCEDCVAEGPCRVATCLNGACVRQDVLDRTACDDIDAGEVTWCVSGECVAAGCGDGLVVVGEACDDGNLTNGDACSDACVGTQQVVRSSVASAPTLSGGRGLSADSTGRLLVVWAERAADFSGETETLAMPFSPAGVPLRQEPVVIHRGSQADTLATAVGLMNGWLVALRVEGTLRLRSINAAGELGVLREVESTDGLTSIALVRAGTGARAAWSRSGSIYGCRFSSQGNPTENVTTVSTSAAHPLLNNHGAPSLAVLGNRWLVAWHVNQQPPGEREWTVLWRRFDGMNALDSDERDLDVAALTLSPAIATVDGQWLLAYREISNDDASGEIFARTISFDGALSTPELQSTFDDDQDPVFESMPVVAPYSSRGALFGWYLGAGQNRAHVVGALSSSEVLASLNETLASASVNGLSMTSSAHGTWVAWVSGQALMTYLIPAPLEEP